VSSTNEKLIDDFLAEHETPTEVEGDAKPTKSKSSGDLVDDFLRENEVDPDNIAPASALSPAPPSTPEAPKQSRFGRAAAYSTDALKSAAEGIGDYVKQVGRSATLGLADKAGALMETYLPQPGADVDKALLEQGFTITQPENTYEANLARRAQLEAAEAERSPVGHFAGELSGYLLPGVGAEKLAAKGLAAYAPRLAALAAKAPKAGEGAMAVAKHLGAKSVEQGLAGGLFGGGAALIEGKPEQALDSATLGAAIGAVAPPVIAGLGKAVKAGISILGPSVEAQTKYLAEPGFIGSAMSEKELKQAVDNTMSPLIKGIESAKISAEQAEEIFKIKSQQIQEQAKLAKIDADQALKKAKEDFSEAVRSVKERLKEAAAPETMVGKIQSTLKDLQSDLTKKSEKSYGILERSNAEVDIASIRENWAKKIAEMKKKSPAQRDAALQVEEWTKYLDQKNPQEAASEIKELIQDLDTKTKWQPGVAYDEVANASLKQLRRDLDVALKKAVPEYAAYMEKNVAPYTEELNELINKLGTDTKIRGVIKQAHLPENQHMLDTLKLLDERAGTDFLKTLEESYYDTKKFLRSGSKQQTAWVQTPEYDAVQKAQAEVDRIKRLKPSEQEAALQQMPEFKAREEAQAKLKALEEKFREWRQLRPEASQASTRKVLKGAEDIELEKTLGAVEKETGVPLRSEMEKTRLAKEFKPELVSKDIPGTNKDAAVYMLSRLARPALGAAIGGYGAHSKGMEGMGIAAGAMGGAIASKYGPTLAKGLLKSAPAASKALTAAKYTGLIRADDLAKHPELEKSPKNVTLKPPAVIAEENKGRAFTETYTDADIDRIKASIPQDDLTVNNVLRNMLEAAKQRDTNGRSALIFQLKSNPLYRPILERALSGEQKEKENER
jgi:hypothetical protein